MERKQRVAFMVGSEVRVRRRSGLLYSGRRGRVLDVLHRPDGRIAYEVYLYLSSSQSTPVSREYYGDELVLVD